MRKMDAEMENKDGCDNVVWAGIREKCGVNSHGEVLSPDDRDHAIIHFIHFNPR